MRRGVSLFLLVYGSTVALLAANFGFGHRYHDAHYAILFGATAAGCILAALGLYFAKESEPIPSKRWMTGILSALVVQWAAIFLRFPEVHIHEKAEAVKSMAFLVSFVALTILICDAQAGRFQQKGKRNFRAAFIGAVSVGTVLTLLTLALKATEDGRGWQILGLRAPWITYEYNIARILPEMIAEAWARALFAFGGCAMYLLTLIEAITGIVLTVSWLANARQLRQAPWLPWLAGASCFTTFYLYNDIFWGWQSASWDLSLDMSDALIYPAIGLILWFAAVACTLWVVVGAARQQEGSRRLRLLQIAQLPIAGFNFLMMPIYFEGDMFVDFPGLGILMIGSQLLTWGYIGLLQIAESEQATERTNP